MRWLSFNHRRKEMPFPYSPDYCEVCGYPDNVCVCDGGPYWRVTPTILLRRWWRRLRRLLPAPVRRFEQWLINKQVRRVT